MDDVLWHWGGGKGDVNIECSHIDQQKKWARESKEQNMKESRADWETISIEYEGMTKPYRREIERERERCSIEHVVEEREAHVALVL